jgi:tetratricopeptide (TPR) repeat protein
VPHEIPNTPTHPLGYLRHRHGWSYQDLARLIADNARALGVPMAARREKIWRWEHWGVVPERDSQRALARALRVPPHELQARPWPGWLPAYEGLPSGLPWTPAGSGAALRTLLEEGTRDNRGYPLACGPGLGEAAREWADATLGAARPVIPPQRRPADPAATGRAETAHEIADGTVEWLESGVHGLRRLDDRLGGGAVRKRVEADLSITAGLLALGPYGRSLDARLFRVAADLAQLGGWAAADCGHHSAAQRHFLTALRLAHDAGDLPLATGVWAGLSLQAVFTGHPGDALAAVDAADSAAGRATRRTRAMLATRRARALAGTGDEAACRRALDDARDLLSGCDGDTGRAGSGDPGWLYWFDGAELDAQAGTALLDLGRPAEALELLEGALTALDPSHLRDRAIYAARAATARLRVGDRDGALARRHDAARFAAGLASPRTTAVLENLAVELRPVSPAPARSAPAG